MFHVLVRHIMNAKRKFKLPMPTEASTSEPKRKDKLGLMFGLLLVTLLLAAFIFR
jgi:hypothetical protein